MKDLGKIILYLIATVLVGALLAPPLYWGAHWLAAHDIQPWLAELPLRKFFNRGALIAAVVLLWPTARWIKVPRIADLGLLPNPHRSRDLLIGFIASFLIMALLAALLMHLEIFRIRKEIQWGGLGQIALSAAVVSVLEEALFRGAILGLLLRSLPASFALLFSSALYSIVHFMKPKDVEATVLGEVHWLSGFDLIPDTFSQFTEWQMILGGFTTLFFVGLILGASRLKTDSLWMAIGLHAGWIMGKMGLGKIARRRIPAEETLPWLGEDITVGIWSIGMVLLTGVLIALWFYYLHRRKQQTLHAPPISKLDTPVG